MVSLARQYQITGLLEAVSAAEEDILDGLFAVSLETSLLPSDNDNDNNYNDATLQTSLLSSEEKATTIPSAGKSDDVIERVAELPSPAEDNTTDSSVQLDNSSSRKVSILLVEEHINNEAAEDNSCTLDTDEDEDMAEAEEALCENCSCIACKDGEVGCSP